MVMSASLTAPESSTVAGSSVTAERPAEGSWDRKVLPAHANHLWSALHAFSEGNVQIYNKSIAGSAAPLERLEG